MKPRKSPTVLVNVANKSNVLVGNLVEVKKELLGNHNTDPLEEDGAVSDATQSIPNAQVVASLTKSELYCFERICTSVLVVNLKRDVFRK